MLDDLRNFIGAFFLIVGLILTTEGFVAPHFTEGFNLNLIVGRYFIAFAVFAWASYFVSERRRRRNRKK